MDKNDFNVINEHKLDYDSANNIVINRIQQLVSAQDFAILCTQGKQTPYGSIVGYAIAEGYNTLLFATPSYTRKYNILSQNDHVAMVIDNRDKKRANISEIESVTLTGIAKEIVSQQELDSYKKILLAKHNYLYELLNSKSCAVFLINVKRYLYVTRLQEVFQWQPD